MSAADAADRGLLGRGSIYTTATLVQLLSGLIVLPLATRILGPRQFGAVATALVIIQALTIIAGLGLPAAVLRSFFLRNLGREAADRLIGAGVVSAVLVSILAAAASPLWVKMFAELRDGRLIWSSIAAAGLMAVVRLCQALLRAQGQAWGFAAVTVLAAVGGQVLGLTAALLIRPDAPWFVGGMVAGSLLGAVAGLMMTGARPPSRSLVRWGLALGFPTVPHALALYVMQAGDRIIIERTLGLEVVGAYHVAYLIGALGATFVAALNNAWSPILYEAGDDEREAILVRTSRLMHRLGAILAVGIALLAPMALRLAAPETFGPSRELVLVVSLVALATMPQVTYLSQVQLLLQYQRTRPLMIVTPLVAALNVLLNLLLLPRYGIVAAAATTLVAYAVQAELIRRARRRISAVRWDIRSQSFSYFLAAAGCLLGGLLPADLAALGVRAALALLAGAYAIRYTAQIWRGSADPA